MGLAAAALGTEVREAPFFLIPTYYLDVKMYYVTEISKTSGSIYSPARVSGVVGLKPTVGLTSRHGVYCVTEWEDSVGVLGRTVVDAATVLTAIAGE